MEDLYELIKQGRIRVKVTTSPPLHRFWNSVDKQGPINLKYGRCWIWVGSKTPKGYGQFTVNHENLRAHRYSYEQFVGEIPAGLYVLHRCDNPSCIRPGHLFLGTCQDNQTDKVNKKRQARGETNGESVLSDDQVREIRRRYRLKTKYHDSINGQGGLAREFGVTQSAISYVLLGQTWKHVR